MVIRSGLAGPGPPRGLVPAEERVRGEAQADSRARFPGGGWRASPSGSLSESRVMQSTLDARRELEATA
jgi:hypothetical protein